MSENKFDQNQIISPNKSGILCQKVGQRIKYYVFGKYKQKIKFVLLKVQVEKVTFMMNINFGNKNWIFDENHRFLRKLWDILY